MTVVSKKLAQAQEVSAAKGLRAAVGLYIEAADELAQENRYDAAAGVLADVLKVREKKRGLFGSKQVNPLGPERLTVAKHFARLTRLAQVNDALLELLGDIAVEFPDNPEIRLANAEGLYRGAYMADAIDEYRYCEKLIPDDGALVARLGELFAVMSRNSEAVDHLRRGIGDLMQAHHFDSVPYFCLKLLQVEPQSANDVQRWLESVPEATISLKRADITKVLDAVRDAGIDDGRWSSLEQRLAALPPLEEVLPEPPLEPVASAEPEVAVEDELQPQPEIAPSAAVDTAASWHDPASVEPASEDEMRMLLGPPPEPERSASGSSVNGAAHVSIPQEAPSASTSNNVSVRSTNIGSTQPTSAGGLPPGLAAFTRRKANSAYQAADFAGAASGYERLMKGGFDAEIAVPLLDCYLGLQRFSEAAPLAMMLADHQASAGEMDQALETLGKFLEHTANPEVQRRRAELLSAAKN